MLQFILGSVHDSAQKPGFSKPPVSGPLTGIVIHRANRVLDVETAKPMIECENTDDDETQYKIDTGTGTVHVTASGLPGRNRE
ncbi:MAG: hypothetical protein WD355_00355 [Balneolaceae bacterium]